MGVGSSILEWANNNNFNTQNVLRFGGPDKFLTDVVIKKKEGMLLGCHQKKYFQKL